MPDTPAHVHSPPVSKWDSDNLGARLPLDKVVAILTSYDNGDSPTTISQHVQSDIRTVGGVIRRYRDRTNAAKALLAGLTPKAIKAWDEAIPIASARGDHRPAKELLQAIGVVDTGPTKGGAGPTVAVQVVLGTPDSPIPYDPVALARKS